ncbi:hypothetical protein EV175_004394, partial [Coemansia sp. RSA 1933]
MGTGKQARRRRHRLRQKDNKQFGKYWDNDFDDSSYIAAKSGRKRKCSGNRESDIDGSSSKPKARFFNRDVAAVLNFRHILFSLRATNTTPEHFTHGFKKPECRLLPQLLEVPAPSKEKLRYKQRRKNRTNRRHQKREAVADAVIAAADTHKKIRRKRQRSLFSMTSADEYSMLDSGRMSGGFDPTGLSYSIRPSSVGTAPLGNEPDSKDPPSLDLLAEMIKEEIRQASSLKQALERIGIETENMTHRVTNLSTDSSLNTNCNDEYALVPDSSTQPGVVRKQVQFTIPDDIRFRWLGIFEQPQDQQNGDSDGESGRNPVSSPLISMNADAKGNAVVPDAAAALDADTSLSGMHGSSVQEGPADQQLQQYVSADSSTAPLRDGQLNVNPKQPSPNTGASGGAEEGRFADSPDRVESESGSIPYTSNSSMEAVYGGSRSDTRESSLVQAPKAQRRADNGPTRLGQLSSAGGNFEENNGGGGVTHKSTSTEEQAENPSRPALNKKNDENEAMNAMRVKRGEKRRSSPSFAKQPTGGGSAFAQPTIATSKVTVPKRYSVSPPFDPSKVEGVAVGKKKALTEQKVSEERYQTSHKSHSNQALGQQHQQNQQRTAGHKGGMGRRRNSYDAPGFQSRGPTASLTHEIPAFELDKLQGRPQNQLSFGGGLFRRVTTSSAQRKGGLHTYQTPRSHDQIPTEDQDGASIGSNTSSMGSSGGAAGLIGGTRDFFRHRLRSRTNSNQHRSSSSNGGHPPKSPFAFGKQGNDATFLETIVSGKASDTVREAVRKRSDVEVKTRDMDPSISPQYQNSTKDDGSVQPPLTVRTLSSESQSSWLAVQDGSTRATSTPPYGPGGMLGNTQRKSHDDVIPSISRTRQGTHRQRARASSSDGYPNQGGTRGESSMRLTKGQIELLRLPP